MIHFASQYRWIVATQYWYLPRKFNGSVLDIGGDDGEFLSRIDAPYKLGLDLFQKPISRLDWVLGDGCYLPFVDKSFDNILAFDVLEHVEDDRKLLNEACRIVRPGGVLWISVPAHNFFLFPGGFIQKRFENSIGHVRRGYSAELLISRLPEGMDPELSYWNEPVFRIFYVALYTIKRLNSNWATTLVRILPSIDSILRKGEAGHLFARITRSADD